MPVSRPVATLVVGDLEFQIRPSARRKTLELIVERDGTLAIATPSPYDEDRARAFVESKRMWLYAHLAEKEQLAPALPPKSYVSGEGFYYLGRSYRLLLVARQSRVLQLEDGRLCLVRSQVPKAREHLIRWFSARAEGWLRERIEQWTERMGVRYADLVVQDLGFRWGSCGKGTVLYFHWKTIQLPPDIIDYVIVHELAHLRESNHSNEFWRLVEQAMPDFESRKRWLAENGAEMARV